MTKNLIDISYRNLAPVSLKIDSGLWGYLDDQESSVSKTPFQTHLKSYFYITTPNGFKRKLHEPYDPILGIILPRRDTSIINMDNIVSFVMHGVEELTQYGLSPDNSRLVTNRRNISVDAPFETVLIPNSNGSLDMLLHAEYYRHQNAVWQFMEEKGYDPNQFFSRSKFYK